MLEKRKQVSRMLAIGSHSNDQIQRITRGEEYTCYEGSEQEHAQLTAFCEWIQDLLKSTGQSLSDYSPEELQDLLTGFVKEGTET
ncbi:hypothetical protein P3T73_11195 [Kiritimatiellota bacterium B12222]|nr:hypothetical protein P3T73_11195 [Kiritimatiellota bacterium B12222]